MFFEPREGGLRIALERPDVDESEYDRAKAFGKEEKFNDDAYRIVMGGELVRLVCVVGRALISVRVTRFSELKS